MSSTPRPNDFSTDTDRCVEDEMQVDIISTQIQFQKMMSMNKTIYDTDSYRRYPIAAYTHFKRENLRRYLDIKKAKNKGTIIIIQRKIMRMNVSLSYYIVNNPICGGCSSCSLFEASLHR